MRAVILVLAASLLAPYGGLVAQQRLPTLFNQQVRVTAPECGIQSQIGSFDGMMGDTLLLAYGTSTVRCVRTSVTTLHVYSGRKSNLFRGALLGLAIGAGGGAVAGAVAEASGERFCVHGCAAAGTLTAISAIVFGIQGVVIGTVAGALHRTDRWEEIPLNQLPVSFAARRDGFSVGVAVSF